MTSKQALEELKFQVGNITYFTKDLQITTSKVRDSGLFEIIEKDLEVLEILKRKKVDIRWIAEVIEKYSNEHIREYYYCQLTPEEFDLVKEWLER